MTATKKFWGEFDVTDTNYMNYCDIYRAAKKYRGEVFTPTSTLAEKALEDAEPVNGTDLCDLYDYIDIMFVDDETEEFLKDYFEDVTLAYSPSLQTTLWIVDYSDIQLSDRGMTQLH